MIAQATALILSFLLLQLPAADKTQTEIAAARTAWIAALEARQVEVSVALYTSDATFLDPTAARFHGATELRSLYSAVTGDYDAQCNLTSRTTESSGGLAYDSGDYDEVLTVRATGAKNHLKGTYLTVYRRINGRWLIAQQAWTVAKPA